MDFNNDLQICSLDNLSLNKSKQYSVIQKQSKSQYKDQQKTSLQQKRTTHNISGQHIT